MRMKFAVHGGWGMKVDVEPICSCHRGHKPSLVPPIESSWRAHSSSLDTFESGKVTGSPLKRIRQACHLRAVAEVVGGRENDSKRGDGGRQEE